MLPFQHNLQRLGIVMDIRQVDNSQYSNRRRSRDYDMMPSLWRASSRRGPTCKYPGRPTIFTQPQRAGVQSPVVDKLIAQILQWQGNKQETDPSRSGADRADLE